MAKNPIVAVIDDDDAVLDALTSLLTKRGFNVYPMSSAATLLSALDDGTIVGCIVSDIKMPDICGHKLYAELKARSVTTPVIFVTGHGDVNLAVSSMKLGVCDFIEKPIDAAQLVASIQDALHRHEANQATIAIVSEMRRRLGALSDRQKDVMRLVVRGRANKEIAATLGISTRTVEHYRECVMDKMQARNIANLVQMAVRLGLLDHGTEAPHSE